MLQPDALTHPHPRPPPAGEPNPAWAAAAGFKAEAGKTALVPGRDGAPAGVLLGLGDGMDPLALGALPHSLPSAGLPYRLEPDALGLAAARGGAGKAGSGGCAALQPRWAALAWALGAYKFGRYKKAGRTGGKGAVPATLLLPPAAEVAEALRTAEAVWMGRDLINTPASDLGPADLEVRGLTPRVGAPGCLEPCQDGSHPPASWLVLLKPPPWTQAAASALAQRHGATLSSVVGDALLSGGPSGAPCIMSPG